MLRKKSKQKFTEKSEDMNDLDLTSTFSSLLKDKKNMTV